MVNEHFNRLLNELILESEKLITFHPNREFPKQYTKVRLESLKRLIELWSSE